MQTLTTGERIYGLEDLTDRYGPDVARRAWHAVAMGPDVGSVTIRENPISGRWSRVLIAPPGIGDLDEDSLVDADVWSDCCNYADALTGGVR